MWSYFLQVIIAQFPKLNTVVEKLLEIFCMLSASHHDSSYPSNSDDTTAEGSSSMDNQTLDVGKIYVNNEGRLVSTR